MDLTFALVKIGPQVEDWVLTLGGGVLSWDLAGKGLPHKRHIIFSYLGGPDPSVKLLGSKFHCRPIGYLDLGLLKLDRLVKRLPLFQKAGSICVDECFSVWKWTFSLGRASNEQYTYALGLYTHTCVATHGNIASLTNTSCGGGINLKEWVSTCVIMMNVDDLSILAFCSHHKGVGLLWKLYLETGLSPLFCSCRCSS